MIETKELSEILIRLTQSKNLNLILTIFNFIVWWNLLNTKLIKIASMQQSIN